MTKTRIQGAVAMSVHRRPPKSRRDHGLFDAQHATTRSIRWGWGWRVATPSAVAASMHRSAMIAKMRPRRVPQAETERGGAAAGAAVPACVSGAIARTPYAAHGNSLSDRLRGLHDEDQRSCCQLAIQRIVAMAKAVCSLRGSPRRRGRCRSETARLKAQPRQAECLCCTRRSRGPALPARSRRQRARPATESAVWLFFAGSPSAPRFARMNHAGGDDGHDPDHA